MGSYIDFKNFNDSKQPEMNGGRPAGNAPLARQSSVYSLTFDEFQNTMGGVGKDFGSMNMDELLKSIWTAEESQALASASASGGVEGSTRGGSLQRQGSLTLPQVLSQKSVDEVWRELLNVTGGAKDGNASGVSNLQQRQQTLGEMTLEEFLVRAGVVREDPPPIVMPNNGGFYGEIPRPSNNNNGFSFGLQQSTQNNGVAANQTMQNSIFVSNQSPSLALNVGGMVSSQPQLQQQQQQQQPQLIFPKQATLAFANPMHLVNNAPLASPGTKGRVAGGLNPLVNNGLIQGGMMQNGATGMAALSCAPITIAATSPVNQQSSDITANSNGNTSSLSPLPYMFREGMRGRKCSGTLEKVQERRHKRMIKNRESAARSRSRKQAYTLELEAEVEKLKEINQELQKKQAEILKMQKNQNLETKKLPWEGKRQCLRRTFTGPW